MIPRTRICRKRTPRTRATARRLDVNGAGRLATDPLERIRSEDIGVLIEAGFWTNAKTFAQAIASGPVTRPTAEAALTLPYLTSFLISRAYADAVIKRDAGAIDRFRADSGEASSEREAAWSARRRRPAG